MKRTQYHKDYYWKNVHKRRRQRLESKQRCKWKSEEITVGIGSPEINRLMRAWI